MKNMPDVHLSRDLERLARCLNPPCWQEVFGGLFQHLLCCQVLWQMQWRGAQKLSAIAAAAAAELAGQGQIAGGEP